MVSGGLCYKKAHTVLVLCRHFSCIIPGQDILVRLCYFFSYKVYKNKYIIYRETYKKILGQSFFGPIFAHVAQTPSDLRKRRQFSKSEKSKSAHCLSDLYTSANERNIILDMSELVMSDMP